MQLNKVKNIIFNIDIWALLALLMVIGLVLFTLPNGVSCDEGFYLMSYQPGQTTNGFMTDFGHIVKAITPTVWSQNIMVYRIERLVLSIISFLFFAYSLRVWLKKKTAITMSSLLFYSIVLLACFQSYTFAAPTISYDSIQLVVYLFSFSFFFLLSNTRNYLSQISYLLLMGIFSTIGVFNYPPSGLFLIATLTLLLWIEYPLSRWQWTVFYFIGLLSGVMAYHILVSDVLVYITSLYHTIIEVFTVVSASRHDAGGLMNSLLFYIGGFLLFVPLIVLFYLLSKCAANKRIASILLGVTVLFFLLYRNIYTQLYAPIYFVPIALLIAFSLPQNIRNIKKTIWRKEGKLIFIIILFTLIPFLAVFGTNQTLYAKMLMFVPFWLIPFFLLYTKIPQKNIQFGIVLIYLTISFAGYVYLGNFSRYHYYYTPRSAKQTLTNTFIKSSVKFSPYQKQYFDELADTLRAYGAKPQDRYMAFGENQMIVFLMNGLLEGRLPYHPHQYRKISDIPPQFLILFKREEDREVNHLKDGKWNFPKQYKRIEMRPMAENMDEEELKTIIYIRKTDLR